MKLLQLVAVVFLAAWGGAPLAAQHQDYHFPVAFPTALLAWEEPHWDGANAVDIHVHWRYPAGSPERTLFSRASVVAVTSGIASRLDNPRGGTAVLLHGDDNRTYYYAHLSRATIQEPRRVSRGEELGTIGRTGTWTQFLEPHLHLSIAEGHQHGFSWVDDVVASRWIAETFELEPTYRHSRDHRNQYRPDEPSGLPFFGEAHVVSTFTDGLRKNRFRAGVSAAPARGAADAEYPLRAPLTGMVRIHQDTPMGLRLQITNEWTDYTVIISGDIRPARQMWSVVERGLVMGYARGLVHTMVFRPGGLPVDPVAR